MFRQKYLTFFFFSLWYPHGSLLIVRSFIYYWLCKTNDHTPHKKREDSETRRKNPKILMSGYLFILLIPFTLFMSVYIRRYFVYQIPCNILPEVSRQFLEFSFRDAIQEVKDSRSKAVQLKYKLTEYQVPYLFLSRLFLLFISFLGLSESNEWNVTPCHWWEAWMSRDKQEANVRREASESTTSWFDYRAAEVKWRYLSLFSLSVLSFIWSLLLTIETSSFFVKQYQRILCTTFRVLDRDWLIHVCTCFSCRILTHSTLLLTKSVILDEFTSCPFPCEIKGLKS